MSGASASMDTARFYELLARLENLPFQGESLSSVLSNASLPQRGVYFFREQGELLTPVSVGLVGVQRITRVGTHAVNAGSKSTLRKRLRAHLGAKSGTGNHRGSIFRLHVGNALLRLDKRALATWGVGSVAPHALRECEQAQIDESVLERRVSIVIGAMPVLWVDVPDEASPSSERAIIERGAIALLSNGLAPLVAPSASWLGGLSTREEIRQSGLWNLRHVSEEHDASFLDIFERAVSRTIGKRP